MISILQEPKKGISDSDRLKYAMEIVLPEYRTPEKIKSYAL